MSHLPMFYSGFGYGYGAAGIPLPLPVAADQALRGRVWIYHPVFIGFLFSLLVMLLMRSCMEPVTRPSTTVLWLHRTPEIPEPVVSERTPSKVVSERETEKTPPPLPELMVRKEIRERPLPMKRPDPIPVPDRAVSPDIRKRTDIIDQDVMRREMRMTAAPVETPEAVSRRQERAEDRFVYHQESAGAIAPALTPVDPVQSRTRTPSRPIPERAAAVDFTPLPSSESVEKPVQASRSESREQTLTPIVAGKKTVAAAGGGAVSQPAAAAVARPRRSGEGMAVAPGRPFSPDLTAVKVPSTASGGEELTGAARVTITGLVAGESARIHSLKEEIFIKARGLNPGVYCCLIQDVQCRLRVTAEENISITFSSDPVSFDVFSRLERRLPEGVKPCVE